MADVGRGPRNHRDPVAQERGTHRANRQSVRSSGPGHGPGGIDVEKSSAGRFGADPQAVYERWHEFREWAATASTDDAAPFRLDELGPPAPRPAQVFAVGANYRSHADEGGLATPEWPMV